MIVDSGAGISTATAYEILKKEGIKLRSHVIPWAKVNWQLPDRDLAATWSTHTAYVARMRVRFGGGTPRWNGEAFTPAQQKSYPKAIAAERDKAAEFRRLPRSGGKRAGN
jgi:hypothetical protein